MNIKPAYYFAKLMAYHDGHFQGHALFSFWALNFQQRKQVSGATLNASKNANLNEISGGMLRTLGNALHTTQTSGAPRMTQQRETEIGRACTTVLGRLTPYFKAAKGTLPYMNLVRTKLFNMLKNPSALPMKIPTWFLTLSSSTGKRSVKHCLPTRLRRKLLHCPLSNVDDWYMFTRTRLRSCFKPESNCCASLSSMDLPNLLVMFMIISTSTSGNYAAVYTIVAYSRHILEQTIRKKCSSRETGKPDWQRTWTSTYQRSFLQLKTVQNQVMANQRSRRRYPIHHHCPAPKP